MLKGQRRYVESLSTYARQFLGIMDKPDVDSIEGLSPAISIDQKTTSRNPRFNGRNCNRNLWLFETALRPDWPPALSYLRPEIARQTLDQIVDKAIELFKISAKAKTQARFLILSPVIQGRKGEYSSFLIT